MKTWKVGYARGSMLELEKELNRLEGDGYFIFEILPSIQGEKTPLWPIVTFTEEIR